MTKFATVHDWVCYAATGQHAVESIHLNRIDDGRCKELAGLDLVCYIQEILVAIVLQLRKNTFGHEVRHAVAFLPVGVTDDIRRWTPQIWESLDCTDEPPSLYLIRDQQIFNDDCEEYRRPILLPTGEYGALQAVFRSFRDQEAIENSWEFTAGIYVIASLS